MSTGQALITIAFVVPWVMGIALAKGFLLTIFAFLFAPYAWMLVAQWAMKLI